MDKEHYYGMIGKQYYRYFVSTLLMSVALSASVVVDGLIVLFLLDTNAFSAINAVFPVTLAFASVYTLFGMGGATLYATALGGMDKERAGALATVSLGALGAVSLLLMALTPVVLSPLAELLSAGAPELQGLIRSYLAPLLWGAPLSIVVSGLVYFIRSAGAPTFATAVLVIANAMNLALDFLYIGVFKMGVAGAGLATITGYFVGAVVVAVYMLRSKCPVRFGKPVRAGKLLLETLRSGSSMAVERICTFLQIALINQFVLRMMGVDGMTVWAVALNCLSLYSMFIGGGVQTMSPIVSTLYGAKDYARIRDTLKRTMLIVGGMGVVFCALMGLFPETILRFYGANTPAQMQIGITALRLYALYFPMNGISCAMMVYYQATQKPGVSAFFGIGAALLPTLLLGALLFVSGGAAWTWFAFSAGTLLVIVAGTLYTRWIAKKHGHEISAPLLLPPDIQTLYDLRMNPTPENIVELSEKTVALLRTWGYSQRQSTFVGIAVEDMTMAIVENNRGKAVHIELRIRVTREGLQLLLMDDGIPLDAAAFTRGNRSEPVAFVQALSEQCAYQRILCLNNTSILFATSNGVVIEEGKLVDERYQ